MTAVRATRIAAAFGFLAVVLGAFGAHALHGVLAANQTTAIWEKAVMYHFIHAVVLLLLALTARGPLATKPFLCFGAGVLIFCGSLYTLALTNLKWLGAITPVGGLLLLAGWALLFAAPPTHLCHRETP